MEQEFIGIENSLFVMSWGFPICIMLGILGYLVHKIAKHVKDDDVDLGCFMLSGVLYLLAGVALLATIVHRTEESVELKHIVETDAVCGQIHVVEKQAGDEYDYYRLECTRVKTIYARVPKFSELSTKKHYKLRLNAHRCLVPGEYIELCIDRAITQYELYSNK